MFFDWELKCSIFSTFIKRKQANNVGFLCMFTLHVCDMSGVIVSTLCVCCLCADLNFSMEVKWKVKGQGHQVNGYLTVTPNFDLDLKAMKVSTNSEV